MLKELVESQLCIYEQLINDDYFHAMQKDICKQRCEFLRSILVQIEEFENQIQAILDQNEQ